MLPGLLGIQCPTQGHFIKSDALEKAGGCFNFARLKHSLFILLACKTPTEKTTEKVLEASVHLLTFKFGQFHISQMRFILLKLIHTSAVQTEYLNSINIAKRIPTRLTLTVSA